MPTIGKEGIVLVGAEDWILYALSAGSTGLDSSPWPQAYHDGQHTGRARALTDLDSPAAVLLRELAYSDSPELKRMALQDIEAHLAGRRYLDVHLVVLEEVLGYLAGEGVIYRSSTGPAAGGGDLQIRLEACALLGELGSEGARAVLLQVMSADEDSERESGQERFHLACARALYRIIMSSETSVHPDNYRALAELAQRDASENVRERASGYLRDLSGRWRR